MYAMTSYKKDFKKKILNALNIKEKTKHFVK